MMMMRIAVENLGLTKFVAKISLKNEASRHIFEKKLMLVEVSRSDVFQEATLERSVDESLMQLLNSVLLEADERTINQ